MKGIIFDSESVKAILAGIKTQSRRVIKPQPTWVGEPYNLWIHEQGMTVTANDPHMAKFARYKVGEMVYVKESYAIYGVFGSTTHYHYKADGALSLDYKTPLFMPESLSRIKLQIVRVGCERVHDISLEDCIKEGIWSIRYTTTEHNWFCAWQTRWIHVNGQASWDSNPWVWVYEFERVK